MGAIKDVVQQGNDNLKTLIPGQNPEVDAKVKDFQEGIGEAKTASLNIAEAQAANSLEKKFIDAFVAILQTWSR
jgi:hypothetical protein